MARLCWFLAIVVVTVVSANDIQGVLSLPEGDDIKIEQMPVIESIPAVELTKSKPIFKNGKVMEPVTMLQPIGPIFPSFFQPGQMFGIPHNIDENEASPKHGILTIILVKNKHNGLINADDQSSPESTQFKQNLLNSAEDKFQSLTQFLLNDLFGVKDKQDHPNEQEGIDRVHLLGGRGDPDHFRGFNEGGDQDQGSDFIRFMNGGGIRNGMGDMRVEDHQSHHHQHGKACNFMKYLKLKAHIHYRTIVHLVFISGIILLILLMISLTIKVHKRRNALRRYAQQSINVSSIDTALAKHQEASAAEGDITGSKHDRLFRSGILRTSYEQKMMPSVLISGPPAYEQINNNEDKPKASSSLIKSLVQNYKNRYERMASSETEDDRKSISSLPGYEEKAEPKE